ncbi:MAG: riboflavin biosynthesis protein RibD [Betaproteobacteria bacterium RIFCSPLOWO2_12_FULL_62_13b]|nr:MAG: riboflavin biosynthesis protein RibD [Betaproteobacteria bacterium RIFCSPLOWO2_12_FULL_62_13b]
MAFAPQDQQYMRRALELAERGLYTTTPNPRVGCVIVRGGQIVSEAWHEFAGELHAEAKALAAAGDKARGATAYVSLEPCSHHGRTPPCADALIHAGVARVVAAMRDPNPLVAGSGLARLAAAGIQTEHGLMEAEARELNIGFVSRMTRGRPWVRMKVAASLDGKTALANGTSQWITDPAARADGHHWRARSCAVLTGVGTVKVDNPRLNVRDVPTVRQPLKVLVDSRLESPESAQLFEGGNVLVFAAGEYPERARRLAARGAQIVVLPNAQGKVELAAMLEELARRGVNELHVESGFRLNGSLLREDCVDELLVYLAPSLIGEGGRGMFDLPEIAELAEQRRLRFVAVDRLAEDVRLIARVVR